MIDVIAILVGLGAAAVALCVVVALILWKSRGLPSCQKCGVPLVLYEEVWCARCIFNVAGGPR